MSMTFAPSPLNVGGGTGDGRKSVQSPTFRAGGGTGGDGIDPPTPTFGSSAGPEGLNMVERIKSVRTTTNYRHLLTEGGTANNANDFVMRIDDTQGVAGVQQQSANIENENPATAERRARLAAAAAGWTPKVRFNESSANLEQQQQDGAAKDLGGWRQRSCDYRLGMKDGKDMSLWEPSAAAAAATTTTTAGPAPGSIERKWRARSLDMSNGSHSLRPPLAESSGTLWRKQFREGAINMSSMENIPFSAWSLKQPLPDLAETQVFSHSDTSDVSKEPSTMNSSGRFSNIGTDSTNSSLGPMAILSRMPSSAAEHQLPNFTENPTYSPATYSPASKRHTRTDSRADKFERVDELGSIRSRRSSSHHSSQRHSFRDEELIVKSPAVPASHYNRVKSRFSEPSKPMAENEYSPPRGGYNSGRSGEIRSGQLRSQQLKTGSRMVDGVEDEEDPFGGAEDLPDRPKYGRKWSCCSFMEWVALVANIAAVVCSRVIPQVRDVSFMGLMLWKWILLLLAILCGRLISGWAVHVLVLLLERNFLMRKRVLYFVYALRRGVKYCVWLALVLMAWNFMFDAKVENANAKLVYITKVLQCFLIAAVLFVIKVFLVKVLASSFHVGTYFERIRDSLFNQYVLETLSGPPIVEIEKTCEDEQKLMDEVELLQKAGATAPGLIGLTDPMVPRTGMLKSQNTLKRSKSGGAGAGEVKAGSGISVQHLHKMNQKNVSAWNMKRLIRLVRSQGVTTLSQSFEDGGNGDGEGMDTEIRSEWQAKAAAKEIFNNVAKSGMTFIDEEDLMRFMQEEEAIRALALFDGAMESGIITRKALKSWVVNVYQERRALALSLSDTKTAVNKLHRVLDVILLVLVLIIWLLVLGVATSQFLVFVSSQLLLIVFVFGNTLKTTFEAIVFLFIMHPFDVGDRCLIDGVQYVVEEMNILTTVFLGDANAKVWFPNSVLATKPIQNFYRSPDMGDSFDFVVSASTPAQKIGVLKDSIGKYIASKSHHWKAKFSLNVTSLVAESGKLQLSLGLSHTMNHQNFGEKVARRSELMWEMKRLFEELAIEYHLPPQEMHVKTLPGSTINVNQSS